MMQATIHAPDDDQLKKWIASSFDVLPQPDNHRLMVIEQQLTDRLETRGVGKRLSKWVWLLAGVLIAGSATATWWVGESYWFDRSEEAEQKIEIPLSADADKSAGSTRQKEYNAEKAQTDVANTSKKKKKSPMIYQQSY